MRTFVCEHGTVIYVQDVSVITEMGFEHNLVTTMFCCKGCMVSVLLDQQIEVD